MLRRPSPQTGRLRGLREGVATSVAAYRDASVGLRGPAQSLASGGLAPTPLSIYAQWLTVTHVRRWHAHHHTGGTGPVYQGRFKSFPIQEDDHFLTVCRYVERNPLRAHLVARAEAWRWSSLWHRCRHTGVPWLSAWPLAVPEHWLDYVNGAETESELAALRRSVVRGAP